MAKKNKMHRMTMVIKKQVIDKIKLIAKHENRSLLGQIRHILEESADGWKR